MMKIDFSCNNTKKKNIYEKVAISLPSHVHKKSTE